MGARAKLAKFFVPLILFITAGFGSLATVAFFLAPFFNLDSGTLVALIGTTGLIFLVVFYFIWTWIFKKLQRPIEQQVPI